MTCRGTFCGGFRQNNHQSPLKDKESWVKLGGGLDTKDVTGETLLQLLHPGDFCVVISEANMTL